MSTRSQRKWLIASTMIVVIGLLTGSSCSPPSSGTAGSTTSAPPSSADRPGMAIGVGSDLPGINRVLDLGENTREGFEYEFTRWLGENAAVKFTPTLAPIRIEQRVRAITDGSVSYVIDVFSITDDKKLQIDMAGPYLRTRQGVMTKANGPKIARIDDIYGRSVCTVAGTTSEIQLQPLADQKLIRLSKERSNSACAERVRVGVDELFSTDQLVLSGFASQFEEVHKTKVVAVSDFTFGNAEEYGIGFKRGDQRTCQMLTDAIREFVISGQWKTYFDQSFPDLATKSSQYQPDIGFLNTCE